MEEDPIDVQPPPRKAWAVTTVYVSALTAGVALIISRAVSPTEASGFVAMFLLAYENPRLGLGGTRH